MFRKSGITSVLSLTVFTSFSKPVMLHRVQDFGSQGGAYIVYSQVKDPTDGSILVKRPWCYLSEKADTDSYSTLR